MSSDLTEHVNLLHDGLMGFMEERAFNIGRGCMLGTGLLPERPIEQGLTIRPRLLVVSGLFDILKGLPHEGLPYVRDLLVAGLLQSNPLESKFTHLGMVGPDLAVDLMHKTSPPNDLEEKDILKLSHSIRLVGPSDMSADTAEWLYQKIITQTLA